MWWFGRWDSTKGAWDIDIKTNDKYRKREEGIKGMKGGLFRVIIAAGVSFASMSFAARMTPIEWYEKILGGILIILAFAAVLVGLFNLIMIFMGIYYFLRYFKYSNKK